MSNESATFLYLSATTWAVICFAALIYALRNIISRAAEICSTFYLRCNKYMIKKPGEIIRVRIKRKEYKKSADNHLTDDDKAVDTFIANTKTVVKRLNRQLWSSSGGISGLDESQSDIEHDVISKKVYRRLLLRHSILSNVIKMSNDHLGATDQDDKFKNGIPSARYFGAMASGHFCASNAFSHVSNSSCAQTNSIRSSDSATPKTDDFLRRRLSSNASLFSPKHIQHDKYEPFSFLPRWMRTYNLAVTDLFVEKALSYLGQSERWHRKIGIACFCAAFFVLSTGALCAFDNLHGLPRLPKEVYSSENNQKTNNSKLGMDSDAHIKIDKPFELEGHMTFGSPKNSVKEDDKKGSTPDATSTGKGTVERPPANIIEAVYVFTKSFTAYGMVVLLAVILLKAGAALMSQYEKILARRHALRQGRLFVHLNGGRITIDELKDAFNWNADISSPFSDINFDAQAPWGRVSKDMFQSLADVGKAGIDAVKSVKTGGKG